MVLKRLFAALIIVALCGCTKEEPYEDPTPEEIEQEDEQDDEQNGDENEGEEDDQENESGNTITKEDIISFINENFSDPDNMTPYGIKATFILSTFSDSQHTELVSQRSGGLSDIEIYGTSEFLYKYFYSDGWYQPVYRIYTQEEDYVCRWSIVLDYYNYDNPAQPVDEPDITASHACQTESTNPFVYSTQSLHQYYEHPYAFSLYGFSDADDALYALSQYYWRETDEVNTWRIEREYELWYYLMRKADSFGWSGEDDYWVTISVNENGNLEITATLSMGVYEYDLIFELTEVGTISKSYEDVQALLDEYMTYTVYLSSSYIGGSSVTKYVYVRQDETEKWADYATNPYTYINPQFDAGTQVGIRLVKGESTITDIYLNDENRDIISYDEVNDLYYFTMPKHTQYLFVTWSE